MGEFDQHTVEDLKEIVDPDRPADMNRQAAHWGRMAELFSKRATALGEQVTAIRPSWSGNAAELFYAEVERVQADMGAAAEIAKGNSDGWSQIAAQAQAAREGVIRIYQQWQKAKGGLKPEHDSSWDALAVANGTDKGAGNNTPSEEEARKPYDEAARAIMDSAAQATGDIYARSIWQPEKFELPPDVAPPPGYEAKPSSDQPANTRKDTSTTKSDNKSTGDKSTPDPKQEGNKSAADKYLIEGHGPLDDSPVTTFEAEPWGDKTQSWDDQTTVPDDTDPRQPVLQNPGAGLVPTPTPTPTPTPGPAPLPSPTGGVGVPVTTVPFRGGYPVPRPVTVPVSRVVLSPNTSVNTVRPVIGARPGTSGMAPGSTARPTPNAMSRPIIGQRAGQPAKPAVTPKKPLIGSDGVGGRRSQAGGKGPVRITRAPKAYTGGETPNRGVIRATVKRRDSAATGEDVKRLSRRDSRSRSDSHEELWRSGYETVPGVITGGSVSDSHDRGPVIDLSGPAVVALSADEHDTVRRLSRRHAGGDDETTTLWRMPEEVGPGVITASAVSSQPTIHNPGKVIGGR